METPVPGTYVMLQHHLEAYIDLRANARSLEEATYRREIERRLEGLNQLREDVVKDRGLLIRSDVYYPKVLSIEDAIGKIDHRISAVETAMITTAASNRNWFMALGGIIVAVELLLRFWK